MNGKFLANLLLCFLLLVVIIFGVQSLSSSSMTTLLQKNAEPSGDHRRILERLTIERNGIRVKRAANQVDALFDIKNASEYDVRNVEIVCQMFDRSGHDRGRLKWLVGEIIEGGSERAVLVENQKKFIPMSNLKVPFNCRPVDLDVVRKPLVKIKKTHKDASHGSAERKHLQTGGH